MPRPEQVSIRRCMPSEELDARIRRLERCVGVLRRLHFIRYRYQGLSVEASAHLVGVTRSVGYTWQRRWNDGGYEGLKPRHGGGRPPKLSAAERETLAMLLRQRGPSRTGEVRDLLRGEFGVEYTSKQIRIILKGLGVETTRSR
ncbi:helix-turn-helix domain-containing protein [Methanothrix harundinacea]|nr:helix-turn-helix domain-containing protein [Methanothrix harundinacea]